jgi:hypothetical protein
MVGSDRRVDTTCYGSFSILEWVASMSGTVVLMVIILSGIGLSGVYLVAEYRRWLKDEAAKRNRSDSYRTLQAGR